MKEMFYNAYIEPCFDYCCIKWRTCNKTEFEKVNKLQKRAVVNQLKRHLYSSLK
jgi:hypothetical protein